MPNRLSARVQVKSMVAQTLYKSIGIILLVSTMTLISCTTNSSSEVSSMSSNSTPTPPESSSNLESTSDSSASDSSASDISTSDDSASDASISDGSVPKEDTDSPLLPEDSAVASGPVDSQSLEHTDTDISNSSQPSENNPSDPSVEAEANRQSPHFIADDHLDSFLYQYYDLINQGNYQNAWAKLAPDMQANTSYDSYVEWWTSLHRVDVHSINHVYAEESGGQVMVLLSYDKRQGPSAREVLVIEIGMVASSEASEEPVNGEWLIKSVDVATSIAPTQTQEATPLLPTSSLVINGIGSIRVGMTLQEAANATGLPMATRGLFENEECEYYEAIGAPDGISFMVSNGRIVRVDIDTETIKTPSGAGIGSSAEQIKALYPGKIQASGHQYVSDGQYLRFVPTDAADQDYRLLFETDETGNVTRFRSGFEEPVGYVEGCA